MLHQRDLRFRLDHAAARRDRRRVNDFGAACRLANAIGDEEAHAFFRTNAVVFLPAILYDARDHCVWALVLLPDAHLAAERGLQLLAQTILLESGRDVTDRAVCGNHDAEGALALAPAHAGVIEAARGAFHEDRVDLLLGHELLGLRDAALSLVVADGHDAVLHRLQRFDNVGESGLGLEEGVLRVARDGERSRAERGGLGEAAAIEEHG